MQKEPIAIYYISRALVDQIYKGTFGPIEEKTLTSQSESTKGLGAKLGLDQLASILTGLKVEGEAKVEKTSGKSETRAVRESVEDRALLILKEALNNNKVADIKEIATHSETRSIYKFSLPTLISHSATRKGQRNLIEIAHKSDRFEFSGFSSQENWISPSLLNSLIWASARSKRSGIQTCGLLTPLHTTKEADMVSVSVQYLIVCHPSLLDRLR